MNICVSLKFLILIEVLVSSVIVFGGGNPLGDN